MSERADIEALVQTYLDGLYEGDTEKLARVFHPTSALAHDMGGELKVVPRDEWLEAVKNRPTPVSQGLARHDEILQIDQGGPTTAFVKVKCAIPPRFFTDYLVLNRTAEGWRIVSKVYRADTRPT